LASSPGSLHLFAGGGRVRLEPDENAAMLRHELDKVRMLLESASEQDNALGRRLQ
jgi:hypothetical protein